MGGSTFSVGEVGCVQGAERAYSDGLSAVNAVGPGVNTDGVGMLDGTDNGGGGTIFQRSESDTTVFGLGCECSELEERIGMSGKTVLFR